MLNGIELTRFPGIIGVCRSKSLKRKELNNMGYCIMGPNIGYRNSGGGNVSLGPNIGIQNRRGLGGGGRVLMGPNTGYRSC